MAIPASGALSLADIQKIDLCVKTMLVLVTLMIVNGMLLSRHNFFQVGHW
jgi:hypothetical protein